MPNAWTAAEIDVLRAAYENAVFKQDVDLNGVALRLGRHKTNICRKARQLGLTVSGRASNGIRKERRKFATPDELRAHQSAARKAWFAEHEHPRGMKGKRHSDETREHLRQTSSAAQAAVTGTERRLRVDKALRARLESQGTLAPPRPNATWKAGWREIGGKRNYYRSRWEANYARYLEWLKQLGEISDWQHEPETFWFESIKRGVRSYLPDFRVWEIDGSSALHEVKGWMDARSKTTLKRMAKYHPGERIIVIREKTYNDIARKVGRMIEGWESGGRADRP